MSLTPHCLLWAKIVMLGQVLSPIACGERGCDLTIMRARQMPTSAGFLCGRMEAWLAGFHPASKLLESQLIPQVVSWV